MPLPVEYSDREKIAIEELSARLKNHLTPSTKYESTIYRFLKARNFEVDKAEKMLRKHIIWRKAHQIDTILQNFKPPELYLKYIEPRFLGFDKEGDLLLYCPAGRLNGPDIYNCLKVNDYMKCWFWFAEKNVALARQQEQKTGKKPLISLILDLDKLEFGNATSKQSADAFFRFTNLNQDNYPETMKTIYVINAPAYYIFIYSIVKAMLTSAQVKKIQVFGYSGWKDKLSQAVDADVLPAFLGGKRTDPDGNPLCETLIFFPVKIPRTYFLSKEGRYFKDEDEVEKVTLPPREKERITKDVKEAGSSIHWEFYTKGKDIGFGLFFQQPESELQDILPIQKYETPDGTEINFYKCSSPGRYVIVFDNSYSRFTSKEVQYCISIQKP